MISTRVRRRLAARIEAKAQRAASRARHPHLIAIQERRRQSIERVPEILATLRRAAR